jgi:hypothetical protein
VKVFCKVTIVLPYHAPSRMRLLQSSSNNLSVCCVNVCRTSVAIFQFIHILIAIHWKNTSYAVNLSIPCRYCSQSYARCCRALVLAAARWCPARSSNRATSCCKTWRKLSKPDSWCPHCPPLLRSVGQSERDVMRVRGVRRRCRG